MSPLAKMFVGILIAVLGVAWYLVPGFRFYGVSPLEGLKITFAGTFGVFLFMFGALMAWVEYEDWKWELREKEELEKARKSSRSRSSKARKSSRKRK